MLYTSFGNAKPSFEHLYLSITLRSLSEKQIDYSALKNHTAAGDSHLLPPFPLTILSSAKPGLQGRGNHEPELQRSTPTTPKLYSTT